MIWLNKAIFQNYTLYSRSTPLKNPETEQWKHHVRPILFYRAMVARGPQAGSGDGPSG